MTSIKFMTSIIDHKFTIQKLNLSRVKNLPQEVIQSIK